MADIIGVGLKVKTLLTTNDDANTLTTGVYAVGNALMPQNYVSEAQNSIIIVLQGAGTHKYQLILSTYVNGIWYRSTLTDSSWKEWKQVSLIE